MHGTEWEEILYIAREEGLTPAFEIPGIRAEQEFLDFLDEGAAEFCNVNEFEMSDGNYRRMQEEGFELQDGHMSAVDGSKDAILDAMADHERVYFCTSVFKDAAQHRSRLKRMARNIRRPFDDVTDDGTLVYGKAWTSEARLDPSASPRSIHRQIRARRTRLVAARGDDRGRRRPRRAKSSSSIRPTTALSSSVHRCRTVLTPDERQPTTSDPVQIGFSSNASPRPHCPAEDFLSLVVCHIVRFAIGGNILYALCDTFAAAALRIVRMSCSICR